MCYTIIRKMRAKVTLFGASLTGGAVGTKDSLKRKFMRIKLYRKVFAEAGAVPINDAKYYFAVTDEEDNLLYLQYLHPSRLEDLEGGAKAHNEQFSNLTWEFVLRKLPSRFSECQIVSKEEVSDRKINRIWERRLDKTQELRRDSYKRGYVVYDTLINGAA
jgi:hypothetical protein